MGRSLNPALCQELLNLEKDADSRKSAMKALKSYVKGLDSKAIPLFLAQVSETKDAGFSSGEYTISLYEVLARVHGPNIVSQIDNIMATIIKTLTTSAGSFQLQQACSKVVPTIARYAIEPTSPEDKKTDIIQSLCKPLSDALLGTQESLSCGSALCLKALVDCDNWKFASDEMVNQVCLRLAGALEDKLTQTTSHMGLVMSLAKLNPVIIEPYARLLVQSGLQILDSGVADRNPQKRLTAIHMIDFIIKCLDSRSFCSELGSIIDEMEKCLSDPVRYVSGAAYEALQTAKRLAEKSPKCDKDVISVTGSNFSGRTSCRRRGIDKSPTSSTSPESQITDSFGEYGCLTESPLSESRVSCNFGKRKNANRKLWNNEGGGVDISFKDGLFSDVVPGGAVSHSQDNGDSDTRESHSNRFPGFKPEISLKELARSRSPSPQKTNSQVNVDSVRIFTTPRKLVRSLQENDMNSDSSMNQNRRFKTSCSCKCECHSMVNQHNQNGLSFGFSYEDMDNGKVAVDEQCNNGNSESASSSEDTQVRADRHTCSEVVTKSRHQSCDLELKTVSQRVTANLLGAIFFVLVAVSLMFLWSGFQDEGPHFVPT